MGTKLQCTCIWKLALKCLGYHRRWGSGANVKSTQLSDLKCYGEGNVLERKEDFGTLQYKPSCSGVDLSHEPSSRGIYYTCSGVDYSHEPSCSGFRWLR